MAKREKKPVHHVQMTDGKRAIIQQLLQEYDIETAEDIQDALKDLLGGTIKEMMEAEMDDHPGYAKSERIDRDDQSDYRNGTKRKQVNTSYGSMTIDVPQDRNSAFEPQVVKKRQKDISDVKDKLLPQIEEWQNRPLDEVYPVLFIDAIHYSVRDNGVIRKLAARIEQLEKPRRERYPYHLCRWPDRNKRGNQHGLSSNGISALHCPSGA